MPQFSREAFHPDAKVSKNNCGFCGKLFFTKKAGSEYCSDKHRKYNHKKREAINNGSNINASLMIYELDKENLTPNTRVFVGSKKAKEYFNMLGIKMTLKSLKELCNMESMEVRIYDRIKFIMRLNRKTWMLYSLDENQKLI